MKMTTKQIDSINALLVDHSDELTAFYDETLYRGTARGVIIGMVTATVACNAGWVVHCIRNWKTENNKKEES